VWSALTVNHRLRRVVLQLQEASYCSRRQLRGAAATNEKKPRRRPIRTVQLVQKT
jgi:hypothetical protein